MKKILIVDDDQTLRLVVGQFLQNHGYVVMQANSAMEGLTLFAQEMPDLIICDVMMPEMDGFDFCRRIRSTRAGELIPLLFLSAKGELDDRIHGHAIGADDYLVKPVNPKELLAKIESQLERVRRVHAEMVRLLQSMSSKDPSHHHLFPERDNSFHPPTHNTLPLTPAEEKVFWEVIQGFTNKQISDRLFISPRTVQTHISKILSKLSLENRSQLVRYAFEKGYKRVESQPYNA
jgi:DNA-binding NarL/FixJ family response regulator